MSVSCECHVLSGRELCDELITRPEEFYRLWSRNLKNAEATPALGRSAIGKTMYININLNLMCHLRKGVYFIHFWQRIKKGFIQDRRCVP